MGNSNTEHSRNLRAKTAAERNQRKIAAGEMKNINLKLKTEVLDGLDLLGKELGMSRPLTLNFPLEHYHKTK